MVPKGRQHNITTKTAEPRACKLGGGWRAPAPRSRRSHRKPPLQLGDTTCFCLLFLKRERHGGQLRVPAVPTEKCLFNRVALLVSSYLSSTASCDLSLCAFRGVKDHHNLLHNSPRSKKACVRQAVLDKRFPMKHVPDISPLPWCHITAGVLLRMALKVTLADCISGKCFKQWFPLIQFCQGYFAPDWQDRAKTQCIPLCVSVFSFLPFSGRHAAPEAGWGHIFDTAQSSCRM